jgi:hypothetical protein
MRRKMQLNLWISLYFPAFSIPLTRANWQIWTRWFPFPAFNLDLSYEAGDELNGVVSVCRSPRVIATFFRDYSNDVDRWGQAGPVPCRAGQAVERVRTGERTSAS